MNLLKNTLSTSVFISSIVHIQTGFLWTSGDFLKRSVSLYLLYNNLQGQ